LQLSIHSSYGDSSYAPVTDYNFPSTFASWHLYSIRKGGVSEAGLTTTQIQSISRCNNKSGVYELRNIWKGDNIFQQAITWKWRGFRKNKKSLSENMSCFIFSYIFIVVTLNLFKLSVEHCSYRM